MKIKANTIFLLGGAALVAWYLFSKKDKGAVETQKGDNTPVIKPETTYSKVDVGTNTSGGSVEAGTQTGPSSGAISQDYAPPTNTTVETSSAQETAQVNAGTQAAGDPGSFSSIGRVLIGG